MQTKPSTKFFAEFIGTFSLVLLGCGAAVISGAGKLPVSGIGILGISLAFGFAVVAMAYTIAGISGCHINPAITIAMLVAGKIKRSDAVGYIIAQFIGATLAAGVLYFIQTGSPDFVMKEWGLGSNGWGSGYLGEYNTRSAFITEAVLTFIFLFVIFGATSKWGNGTMAGLAIGIALVLVNFVGIPVTGTSVNPARSFGPAVFAGGIATTIMVIYCCANCGRCSSSIGMEEHGEIVHL
jgi:aquaporin Z